SEIAEDPERFVAHEIYGELACAIQNHQKSVLATERVKPAYVPSEVTYTTWGEELIDPQTFEQMDRACSLPVTRFAALMPDAHIGYGLPIGGVLATKDAVIPYAVGVDIACRVMISVYDLPIKEFRRNRQRL